MRKIFTLLAALGLTSSAIFAQQGKVNGTVSGSVKAVEGAAVSLLKAKDSSIAKLAVVDKAGNFEIEKVKEGAYLVSVQSLGYNKYFSEKFEISAANPSYTVKAIQLIAANNQAKGVTVTAKRALVEHKIDRMVVNVEASITNAGSNAMEVLEKSPGISVDKDGNISLKGKQGVMIFMDGRPSQLGGTDLANYLRGLNASQLDQIEIMTNPPAKYDAAGNAGIINIKTKKTTQFGYNGSLSLNYVQGVHPKANESFSFNYRKNKVNIFTTLSHNYGKGFNQMKIQRNFIDANTKQLVSFFDQESNQRMENRNYSAKLGMDYFMSKKTTLGFALNGFASIGHGSNKNTTHIYEQTSHEVTKANSANRRTFNNFSSNVNFRHVLDSTGKEITADVDYSTYDNKNRTSMINSYFDAVGNSLEKSDSLYGLLPQIINIYSGRVDYVHPLKKGFKFEAGVKTSIVETDNNAIYDSVQYGKTIRDENRSNHFIYKENINAAYVNLSGPLGKKWNGQFGLRMENTIASGHQVKTGQKFDRNYTQLFPTAFIQYKADEKNNYGLNYGRRIRRPNYESLNPFIQFLDRYTFQQGNPNLKPEFTHNIELSHTYRNFLTTTLNYSTTNDIMQTVIRQDESKNETFVRRENIAKQHQYGVSVNANLPLNKWWTSSVFVNGFNNHFEGLIDGKFVELDAMQVMINSTQQFKLNKTANLEISGFYRTKGLEGVIVGRPMGAASLGFSQNILKNQGSIRINIRDIFYTQQFRGESKYSNVDAKFSEARDSRTINIGFTYRFSKGKISNNAKKRAGSASEEQSRAGGGN